MNFYDNDVKLGSLYYLVSQREKTGHVVGSNIEKKALDFRNRYSRPVELLSKIRYKTRSVRVSVFRYVLPVPY